MINDGDALALPPGYMFTDMISHAGAVGIKIVYAHRGLFSKLQAFYNQRSLYSKDEDDVVLKAVLQDIVFLSGVRLPVAGPCVEVAADAFMFHAASVG